MSELSPTPGRKPLLSGDLERWALVEADSLAFLPVLPDGCVDVVITDPPYGIGFGGKAWDSGALTETEQFSKWAASWASHCLRLLKPGGYLVAFGAPRTFHRLVLGVEQAGFEIRDQLLWLFTAGAPKARRLEGDQATRLKPAYEPILLARRPFQGTTPDNLAQYGTGAMNIGPKDLGGAQTAHWPANVVLSHDAGCLPDACAESCAVALLDHVRPDRPPSRFFFCSKASKKEREAGCEQLPTHQASVLNGRTTAPRRNIHPTVKPLDLMRWLVRLTCPVGGLVLDPFTGSGSTGIAAVLEQRQFFGIERERAYAAVSCSRLEHWTALANEGKKTTPQSRKSEL